MQKTITSSALLFLAFLCTCVRAQGTVVDTRSESIYPTTDYNEDYRNQFHFSQAAGWVNDVNGVWYDKGIYHLMYQHNPDTNRWHNMHWGYATSPDLLHWTQHNPALDYGVNTKAGAYSGTALIDFNNTSKLGVVGQAPYVLVYTDTGRGQCLAYSNDGGKTWIDYAKNPVLPPGPNDDKIEAKRDPKVFWHPESKRWVMFIFREKEGMQIWNSRNLKKWKRVGGFAGKRFWECPDIFRIKVDGTDREKWVLLAALGTYYIGEFDGKTFTPETEEKRLFSGPDQYAAQTFMHMPDDRIVQMGWLGMWGRNPEVLTEQPWFHAFTLPVELTLFNDGDSLAMGRAPVQEFEQLWGDKLCLEDELITPGINPLTEVDFPLFDLEVSFDPTKSKATKLDLDIGSRTLTYDLSTYQIANIVVPPMADGLVRLRLLIDRGAFELFGNEGRVSSQEEYAFGPNLKGLTLRIDGALLLKTLMIREVKSAW